MNEVFIEISNKEGEPFVPIKDFKYSFDRFTLFRITYNLKISDSISISKNNIFSIGILEIENIILVHKITKLKVVLDMTEEEFIESIYLYTINDKLPYDKIDDYDIVKEDTNKKENFILFRSNIETPKCKKPYSIFVESILSNYESNILDLKFKGDTCYIFNNNDDDGVLIVENNKKIRKLFVNCFIECQKLCDVLINCYYDKLM